MLTIIISVRLGAAEAFTSATIVCSNHRTPNAVRSVSVRRPIGFRTPSNQIPFAARSDSVRYTMTFREQKDEAACGSDRFVEVVQHERAEHDKRYRYHERNMKQRYPVG